MVLKILDPSQQRAVILETQQMRQVIWLPHSSALREFPATVQGEETQADPSRISALRRQTWIQGDSGSYNSQDTVLEKREPHRERTPKIHGGAPPGLQQRTETHVDMKELHEPGTNHPKGWEETVTEAHTWSGVMFVLQPNWTTS